MGTAGAVGPADEGGAAATRGAPARVRAASGSGACSAWAGAASSSQQTSAPATASSGPRTASPFRIGARSPRLAACGDAGLACDQAFTESSGCVPRKFQTFRICSGFVPDSFQEARSGSTRLRVAFPHAADTSRGPICSPRARVRRRRSPPATPCSAGGRKRRCRRRFAPSAIDTAQHPAGPPPRSGAPASSTRWASLLPSPAQPHPHPRRVPVVPGALHQHSADVVVAHPRDLALALAITAAGTGGAEVRVHFAVVLATSGCRRALRSVDTDVHGDRCGAASCVRLWRIVTKEHPRGTASCPVCGPDSSTGATAVNVTHGSATSGPR